jgi:hypothetical protein
MANAIKLFISSVIYNNGASEVAITFNLKLWQVLMTVNQSLTHIINVIKILYFCQQLCDL